MGNETLTRNEDIVDGRYRPGPVISRTGRGTVCEAESDGDHGAAVIKVRERDGEHDEEEDREDPIERWRSAMELAHPNLLKIYAAGRSVLNDVPVTYAVMERADESLAGVLETRPLTEEETREMLVSATAALRYLHEKGYAHSRLRPSNVLAVGEQVKLSTDGLTRMDDGGSAAEDMGALGVLIVQALTQQLPNGHGDSRADVPAEIPQPFREVAQHCLDPDPAMRWTAGQVLTILTTRKFERPLPATEAPGDAGGEAETHDEDKSTKGIPKWIYAGLAALVVIVFLVAGLRKKDSAEGARIPARVAEQTAPAEISTPAPFPMDTPSPRMGVGAAPAVAGASERKANGWSVIVAAYASREAAENRMREMAKRWPSFHPSVFQPQTGKTHYVVVLGQNLSEDQAEALRKTAVAAGLPRDTYIKKTM